MVADLKMLLMLKYIFVKARMSMLSIDFVGFVGLIVAFAAC